VEPTLIAAKRVQKAAGKNGKLIIQGSQRG
jgi:hypothetical protein